MHVAAQRPFGESLLCVNRSCVQAVRIVAFGAVLHAFSLSVQSRIAINIAANDLFVYRRFFVCEPIETMLLRQCDLRRRWLRLGLGLAFNPVFMQIFLSTFLPRATKLTIDTAYWTKTERNLHQYENYFHPGTAIKAKNSVNRTRLPFIIDQF